MKSRDNLVRLKQFQVNDKKRQLAQLDTMIAEFERMAGELDVQIGAEERKAGITDINHFAYPTFAKAARQRRDNLKNSQADLMSRRDDAQALLDEAEAELSKAEAIESRGVRDVVETAAADGGVTSPLLAYPRWVVQGRSLCIISRVATVGAGP